jgi:hypothetical protein
MRASLLTRVGSLAAAAAIATTGAIATAGAAGAAATNLKRLPTSLSAVAIPGSTPKHHHFTAIIGRLTSHKTALRNEVVYLDRRVGPSLIAVAHHRTDKFGAVAFIVTPQKATQYMLIFTGTVNFAPSHSKFVTARP